MSHKWEDCKEARMHLLCHHVAAVNTSMPMTDVKLHKNLEIRYGTKKRDARKRLVHASMLMQPSQATEWTHVLCHYMETNGKMANRSVALPELGLSASGQMLQATSQRSVAIVPGIPWILQLYTFIKLHQQPNTKTRHQKPPQKPYYSPSGCTSTGPLMASYIIIILTLENGILRP